MAKIYRKQKFIFSFLADFRPKRLKKLALNSLKIGKMQKDPFLLVFWSSWGQVKARTPALYITGRGVKKTSISKTAIGATLPYKYSQIHEIAHAVG